jgi:carboxyl-terminal processing protease
MASKFDLKEKVHPDEKLKFITLGMFVLISWGIIGVGGFLTGRNSKVCTTQEGEVIVDNSKVGEFTCSVIDRARIFILEGAWQPSEEKVEVDMSLFSEVWYLLQEKYIEPKAFEGDDMKYSSIKGLVKSADDPYTVFLTPEETQAFDSSNEGKYEGIGAEIDKRNGQIIIVAPLKGSPAKEAGLKPGDIILEVDGNSMENKEPVQAVLEIRGEKGTEVVLTIARGNETKEISVKRDEIKYDAIIYKGLKENNIALIQVNRFTEATSTAWRVEWDKVMKQAAQDNPEGIIIDLRGNTGGYLGAALHALDYFLEDGKVKMKIEGQRGVIQEVVRASEPPLADFKETPMVVLVNGTSASASEIFTGALQDHERAVVIGTSTFGKGSVQDVVDFNDGSSLHITIQKWLLPSGQHLDENNKIEPDKVVEITEDQDDNGEDPQLDKALEILGSE